MAKRFPIVGEVRGLGLMIGFELVHDQASKERAPDLRDRLEQLAFERGLLVLGAGPNSIRLSPPLVINRDQADFAVDTLEACLKALAAVRPGPRPRCRLRDQQIQGSDRARPQPGKPRRRAGRSRPLSLSFSRRLIRPGARDSRDRARGGCDPLDRGISPAAARGGTLYIVTPHYTDFSSFCDPTHRWHLNSYSLRYFGDDNAGFGYYSEARFRERSVRVKLLNLWR